MSENEEAGTEEEVSMDDWAAAMGEQVEAEAAAAVPEPMAFDQFAEGADAAAPQGFDMIMDIPVTLNVELGRTRITIRNLLQLAHGSIVELEGMAGEPMDVLINGTLIAQGEVVVVNEKFGIRLTDVITPKERMRKLNR